MKQDANDRINQLINQLKVNDKIDPNEVDEDPPEPKQAMEEIAKIGQPAVAPLIKVLKNPSNYSCVYAITVLGQIAAPEAAKPIFDSFTSKDFISNRITYRLKDFSSEVNEALHKIGLPALEPVLTYLKEKREQKDTGGILQVTDVLTGIKDEKSFATLVDLLNEDALEKEYILTDLVQYGDPRAIEPLKKLIKEDQDEEERRGVFEAIHDLAPTEIQMYQELIAPYAVKDTTKLAQPIHEALRELRLSHEYGQEFEGENAKEFNSIVLRYKTQEAIDGLLRATFELGSYEGVLPNQMLYKIGGEIAEIRNKWYDYKQANNEIIEIINNRFPEDCQSQVTKSYKGLAKSRYESGPKIAQLKGSIQQWLRDQSFSVTTHHGEIWGFKGEKGRRQGCVVSSGSDYDRARSWGTVYLGIWGKGWTEDNANSFSTAFWDFSEKTIRELIGTKKLQSLTISPEDQT